MEMYSEFVSNHLFLVIALMLSIGFVVFTELQQKAQGIASIDQNQAITLMNNGAEIIDLRNTESFRRGHIVRSKNIPNDELGENYVKLQNFKSKSIVVVCENGIISSRIANKLRKANFEKTYGLHGGIVAWSEKNLPLVTSKKTKS